MLWGMFGGMDTVFAEAGKEARSEKLEARRKQPLLSWFI